MVVLTGDIHGDFERIFEFCEEYDTTTQDIIMILGDAGINYHLDARDAQIKDELEQLPVTLFCIHGNHEELYKTREDRYRVRGTLHPL